MGEYIYVKDIVYDTQTKRFMVFTYTTREQCDAALMDSVGFLPIRKSANHQNVNIYKVKSDKNKIIKIAFTRGDFHSVKDYKNFIDRVLAEHGRTRDELVLVKKIVDEQVYNTCCKLARTREEAKLMNIYKWKK